MLPSVQQVPGWPVAFRGSAAIAAGLVTPKTLRGPRFLRLFPDTYHAALPSAPDLTQRSRAAYRYAEGRGVLAGYSAAELLGASCGRRDAPAEIIVPHLGQRRPPGLLVHREQITAAEVVEVGDVRVTSPVRTAFDIARRNSLLDGVIAVDRLANVHRFHPDRLLDLAADHRGARGVARIAEVVANADARSGSPMETRLRMIIVTGGLPRPEVQCPVPDELNRTVVWLDLAYPDDQIGIEYDGVVHTEPDAVLRDIGRHTALLDQDWRVYRYTKLDVLGRPDRIVAQIRRALQRPRST